MYERFDGHGFPAGLAGKRIPLGARVLALCDTYSDLTLNPTNPYRKELSHEEAHAVLDQFRGTLFDPDLVDLLSQLVVGEDLRRRLSGDRPLVVVVEPDVEEATMLDLRLVAQGFEVRLARSAEQALEIARADGAGYVLSEVELEPFDGFELLRRLRADAKTRELPFLFVARASDSATIDRAFSLGAQDYIVKPTSGDVLAGKLRRLAATSPASKRPDVSKGVAGSLSEMALPDLVQILGHGRKSGRLELRSEGRKGEIHFRDGRVVHALLGEARGNDAFFELLAFSAGTFALDPAFSPGEQSIQGSSDMLILEGLRRLDERNR
jgi:response regulator RpfG family c-di-GMP phosphodiesterase